MTLIAIADDHRLMRDMLADAVTSIEGLGGEIEVVQASTYDELHKIAATGRIPHLILLDFHMPGISAVANVLKVIEEFDGIPILVVSGTADPVIARQCLEVGAAGFLPKTVSALALRNAVRVVLDGERYIHSFVLPGYVVGDGEAAPPQLNSVGVPRKSLWSEREQQTIDCLVGGMTNKQIACRLEIQEMTVKTHVRNIYRKLGAVNRADAVRMVLQAGTEQRLSGA